MLDSTAVRMRPFSAEGMYESFYFRGTSDDGARAFWLKHNILRYRGAQDVWLECALILFDRASCRTAAVYAHEAVDAASFARAAQVSRDWDHVGMEMRSGATVRIGRGHVGGEASGEGGAAKWELALHRSGIKFHHFPFNSMYALHWPRNKVLTRDCRLRFEGTLQAGDLAFEGEFTGMNGHNWGTAHAHAYAYANCAQFADGQDAYFDGFSARIAPSMPWMTVAGLYLRGRWHLFNGLWRAMRQPVRRVDDYAWSAEVFNATHRLRIEVDGATPAQLPWIALNYENPDRTRSVVKSTKLAAMKLHLATLDGHLETELASDAAELETLLPGQAPFDGFIGAP